ncbi:hypothetical protein ACWHA1_31395 [Streptomyces decoyicus]
MIAAALTMGFTPAAPTASAAPAKVMGPACLDVDVIESQDVGFDAYITNHCGRTVYVQVIIGWGPDSGCYPVANEKARVVSYRGVLCVYEDTVFC